VRTRVIHGLQHISVAQMMYYGSAVLVGSGGIDNGVEIECRWLCVV
jgi:hypothetical protein